LAINLSYTSVAHSLYKKLDHVRIIWGGASGGKSRFDVKNKDCVAFQCHKVSCLSMCSRVPPVPLGAIYKTDKSILRRKYWCSSPSLLAKSLCPSAAYRAISLSNKTSRAYFRHSRQCFIRFFSSPNPTFL